MPFLIAHIVLCLGLVGISWIHGLPFLEAGRPIEDIHYQLNPASVIATSLLALLVFNSLILFLRRERLSISRRFAVGLAVLCSCSLPMNSGDFFSYVQFARLFGLYGLSPYTTPYGAIHDDYLSFTWFNDTTNYGPLAHLGALPAAWMSALNPYLGFVVLKLTWLLLGLLAIFLLRRIERASKQSDNSLLFLFALNPLWLVEVFINGHNDIIAVALLLLLIDSIWRKKTDLIFLAGAALPLFKLPLGVVPAFLALFFGCKREWRKAGAIVFITSIGLGGFVFLLGGLDALAVFLRKSAPLTAHSLLGRMAWLAENLNVDLRLSPEWAFFVDSLPFVGGLLMLATVIGVAVRAARDPHRQAAMIHGLGVVMLSLAFFWGTQFWPWYGLWVLPFTVSLWDRIGFRALSLGLGFAGLATLTPFYWRSLGAGPSIDALGLLWVGLPFLVLIAVLANRPWRSA